MTEKSELLIHSDSQVCTLVLNRPSRRNSLSNALLGLLSKTLEKLEKDVNVRVVIIRGTGDQAFCAGFDINEISTGNDSKTPGGEHQLLEETFQRLRNLSKPVIAMINGVCIGGGLDLALNCDFRVAMEGARLGMTPAKLGVTYHPAGLNRFIQLVGVNATKELFFTGKLIPAEKALKLGLINQVATAEELGKNVYALAREIAGNAPLSLESIKYTINKLTDKIWLSLEEEEIIRKMTLGAFSSEDFAEGKEAFLQRRKPRFKGK
ncbi:MAG: hypothetical protein FH756_04285 [Firmicutes bacterium]|nr:hypothetical protein [Bacillota bacterium]